MKRVNNEAYVCMCISQCAARITPPEEADLVQTYGAGGGSADKYIRRGEDSIPIAR